MKGNTAPKRADSFFGLHFDLHPKKDDTILGRDITEDMVLRLLDEVKPDYVQYDCKGHPGYAGYPTEVGTPSPGIVKDSLAIWREATRKRGVALYVHYSGVWDSIAIEQNPDWARIDEEGKADPNATSTFGPYCDELLIPQLKEAIDFYDLDGVWVDGDCWATKPDYNKAARRAFEERTGSKELPRKFGEPGWNEFLDLCRSQFRKQVRKYVDALHEHKSDFQIASNWMYSTLAPEPVTIQLDYISGDFSPVDSVNNSRMEARYMSSNGLPWDLMAWGHNRGRVCKSSIKNPVQLKQEASVVISQGGGFQVYYNPTRGGWIDDWMIRIMADVSRFCRVRREFSHPTETVPQVAMLLSRNDLYRQGQRLFGPWGEVMAPAHGMLHALLELHLSVDVLAEHQLGERANDYPMVVLPEWQHLPGDLVDALVEYAKGGGLLVLVGSATAGMFEDHLGVDFDGDPQDLDVYLEGGPALAWVGGSWQMVEANSAETVGGGYLSTDTRGKKLTTATVNKVGDGKIAAIYGPYASVYRRSHNSVMGRFLRDMLRNTRPHLMALFAGRSSFDVALRRKGPDLLAHISNTNGMQLSPDHTILDTIPSTGPIFSEIRSSREPEDVFLEPWHRPVEWLWVDGELTVFIDQVPIHSVLVAQGLFED
jgi:hypothetical protein